MTVHILNIGVTRPTLDQIKENILHNIDFFKTKFPDFKFYVLTYENSFSSELTQFIEDLGNGNVFFKLIKPIPYEEFPEHEKRYKANSFRHNTFRMFKSMQIGLDFLKDPQAHDLVIRTRIDTQVKNLEFPETINSKIFYSSKMFYGGRIQDYFLNDNLVFGSHEIMTRIWNIENLKHVGQAFNNEEVLSRITLLHKIQQQGFNFHLILYQGDHEFFDGIKQWSKSNKEFICKNSTYYEIINIIKKK